VEDELSPFGRSVAAVQPSVKTLYFLGA
jgi:hypothetical protein